jgi:hypothetical protein
MPSPISSPKSDSPKVTGKSMPVLISADESYIPSPKVIDSLGEKGEVKIGGDNNIIDYYDPKIINDLKQKINDLKQRINDLNNKTTEEYVLAKKAVENYDKKSLDKHNFQAVDFYEQMKKLKLELEEINKQLLAAESLPKLNADKAKEAAEAAKIILNDTEKLEIKGGGNIKSDDILVNDLIKKINNLKIKINDLNIKTLQEYKNAKNDVIKNNKTELDKHNNQAVEFYNQMKKFITVNPHIDYVSFMFSQDPRTTTANNRNPAHEIHRKFIDFFCSELN